MRRFVTITFVLVLLSAEPSSAATLARAVDAFGNVTYTFTGADVNETLIAARNATTVTFTLTSSPAGAILTDAGGLAAANCATIGTGNITCPGTVARFVLNGGNGNDALTVTSAATTPAATLSGGNGNDTLVGAAGADTLTGGLDNDTLVGADGNDSLAGSEGNDTLTAGDGVDSLVGGPGTDTLDGGTGNDTLNPGPDDDNTVTGGDDIDVVTYDDGRTVGVSADLSTTAVQDDGGPTTDRRTRARTSSGSSRSWARRATTR